MEIQARRLLAVEYRCPECSAHHAWVAMAPTRRNRQYIPRCIRCSCNEEIIGVRYYTTFASDFYSVAGTCGQLGPFTLCNIVFPNIRAFRKFVVKRQAELEEQSRKYMEEFRRQQEETEARLERERKEAALLKEVEQIAFRRVHAVELAAEQVAREAWPEEIEKLDPSESMNDLFDDDHPF